MFWGDIARNSNTSDECNSSGSQNSEDSSHSKIKLYNYQNELAAKAKNGTNCIICSPTGSGKTITAGSVIDHHLKEAKKNNQSYRVLYLVHIRFLVKHLAIDVSIQFYCFNFLNNYSVLTFHWIEVQLIF